MKNLGIIGFIGIILLILCACQTAKVGNEADGDGGKFGFLGTAVESFEVMTYNDEKLTNSAFTDHKLTMVNFWSPSCKPCLEELPELDKLNDQLKKLDVQIVSVCVDGKKEDVADLKESYKMAYPIVVLNKQSIMKECMKDFEFIPFTVFVDQKGHYTKKYIIGSQTADEYLKAIQEQLEE